MVEKLVQYLDSVYLLKLHFRPLQPPCGLIALRSVMKVQHALLVMIRGAYAVYEHVPALSVLSIAYIACVVCVACVSCGVCVSCASCGACVAIQNNLSSSTSRMFNALTTQVAGLSVPLEYSLSFEKFSLVWRL